MGKKREDIVLLSLTRGEPLLVFLPQHETWDGADEAWTGGIQASYVGAQEAQQESQLIKRQPGMHKVEPGTRSKAFRSQNVMLDGALWPANWPGRLTAKIQKGGGGLGGNDPIEGCLVRCSSRCCCTSVMTAKPPRRRRLSFSTPTRELWEPRGGSVEDQTCS